MPTRASAGASKTFGQGHASRRSSYGSYEGFTDLLFGVYSAVMKQTRHPRFASFLAAAALLLLSAGAGAIGLIEFIGFEIPAFNLDSESFYKLEVAGLSNTGFSIQSRDGAELTINGGSSAYGPARA